MNIFYKLRYEKFIISIKELGERTFNGYTEMHHIIPKCLKGSDDSSNLIKLTLREHFLAHWLLWKAYPNYLPLASAFLQMNNKNPNLEHKGFQGRINSKSYQKLKTEVYDQLKEYTTDKVRIKDQGGQIITLTREEYAVQTELVFHTKGKIYVYDTEIENWVYVHTDVYHSNKDRYKSRLSLSDNDINFAKYQFLDIETNEIIKITKSEARKRNKEYGYKRLKNIQKKTVKCVDREGNIYRVSLEEYNTSDHTFYLTKTVNVFDTIDNKQKIISASDYYLNKNRYLTSTKGKVLAKDKNGKKILVTNKEFESGEFVGQTKGLTTVFDHRTQKYTQITTDEFLQNKSRYSGPNQGKVNVIDKQTGKRQQISKNEFDKTRYCSLGDKKFLFKCRNKLTNVEENINIYEWHLVKDDYEILDIEKYNNANALK